MIWLLAYGLTAVPVLGRISADFCVVAGLMVT